MIELGADALAASNRRTVGQESWGQERCPSRWVQGERSLLASGVQGSAIAPMIHGSVQVERDVSKPCE